MLPWPSPTESTKTVEGKIYNVFARVGAAWASTSCEMFAISIIFAIKTFLCAENQINVGWLKDTSWISDLDLYAPSRHHSAYNRRPRPTISTLFTTLGFITQGLIITMSTSILFCSKLQTYLPCVFSKVRDTMIDEDVAKYVELYKSVLISVHKS
jgi:hypothetical protein